MSFASKQANTHYDGGAMTSTKSEAAMLTITSSIAKPLDKFSTTSGTLLLTVRAQLFTLSCCSKLLLGTCKSRIESINLSPSVHG